MPTEAFNVRTDSRIIRQLDKLAKHQNRSRNFIVNEAIENYLELHAWQEQRIWPGIEAADQGRFARKTEMERVFSKYG